ncbi:hypothetical protein PSUM_18180 [Pseudomonas umsongensis]|uniref:Uncharacterized protein n=1 Tax=Pseudomonas umsongensis TaxID=198618 RepID=A0ABX4DTR9_9PSED|nr:hypothetical protein PSUM_18180 [Pseudomonas umsongensis]
MPDPNPCRSEHAPGGVPTMNLRTPRGVRLPASSLTTIASVLAPTGEKSPEAKKPRQVGALR